MSGKSIISNSYLEDIGDAIRYKKGTEETFYPSQMGDAIRSIEGIVPTGTMEIDANGVYDVTEKAEAVVNVNPDLRPLSVSENGTYQPDGFDGYSSVTADIEPNLTSLAVTENGLYLPESGTDGFDRVNVDVPQPSGSTTITQNGTYNVEQYASAVVDVPSADYTIEDLAEGLQPSGAVDLGDTETVAQYALSYRLALTSVTGSSVTNVQAFGFAFSAIESITLPFVTTIGQYTFQGCRSLTTVHLPRTNLNSLVFLDASAVEFLFLPSAISLGSGCFQRCTNLQTVILPAMRSLNAGNVFIGDANLKTIVLGYENVVDCNASMFGQTPFASGGSGGDIYIPKALYDHLGDGSNLDYLHNTKWNTFNSYGTITWHPIEGSEYETYMPGGAKYEEEMALT